jgi:hypothetical protein
MCFVWLADDFWLKTALDAPQQWSFNGASQIGCAFRLFFVGLLTIIVSEELMTAN